MSEMVDRVAKAMHDCALAVADPDAVSRWPAVDVGSYEIWIKYACAAIPAMREPTNEMLMAAGIGKITRYAIDVWVDMIDAALK